MGATSEILDAKYYCGLLSLVGISLMLITLLPAQVYAQDTNSAIFPLDSRPYGLSYDQWGMKWWQWFSSIPASKSPASDSTGARCSENQNDTNVWYLAATFGGKAERMCEVDSDKALFFTVIGTECNAKQDKVTSEAEFQSCVHGVMDGLKLAAAQLDGKDIPSVEKYRITSSVFPVDFPDGAVWGAPPGPNTMSADAVYLMLRPLPTGNHILHFNGEVFNPTNPAYNQATDVTYHLVVK